MKVLDHLLKSLRDVALHNPEVQVAPACILWPDRERQWEAVIPRLQAELPELLVLGDYTPERRTGPAIWLRCVLAGQVDAVIPDGSQPPILYLPGVGRQDLRAVDSCPDALKPLAELQYRGVIWSQVNAKDWTVPAFLKSDQGGLALDVAKDHDTRRALLLALHRLLDEELDQFRGKRLDKDTFNTLLSGGDPVRELLHWLDQGEAFRAVRSEPEWQAFVEVCKSQFGFDPQAEGVLGGVARLADRDGPWRPVRVRYGEAWRHYPNIAARLRQCTPPGFDLLADADSAGGWPQWNETEEQRLRAELRALDQVPAHQARDRLEALERQHGERRGLVWAEQGAAPLALALESLAVLAGITRSGLAAGTTDDLANGYRQSGWRADDAVIRALESITSSVDFEAVSTAVRAVYLPWTEASARHLQAVVDSDGYPGGTIDTLGSATYSDGECVLFVDGLRFDTARRLAELLGALGCEVTEQPVWAALPSVTATGKPAVSPVRERIHGSEISSDFEPGVKATGQSLKGGYPFRKLLEDIGWQRLESDATGDAGGRAWCEFGDIDHEGHDRGWKLARQLAPLLAEIRDRIDGLLTAGWQRVRVVTDHGWLLLPGGLPKIDLPAVLTESKWGRCAALKPGASTTARCYPWFWNPQQRFVLADGIGCFRKGEDYAHGGLSLQECLTLELTVTRSTEVASTVTFTDVVWKGLRCTIAVQGRPAGLSLDIRIRPGDADSSVVVGTKPLKDHGTASVVVEDEELEGRDATLVLIDGEGVVVARAATVIGGDEG